MDDQLNLQAQALEGARNLLRNCVELGAGQSLLLIQEDRHIAYFDGFVGDIIADEARAIGAEVFTLQTPRADGPEAVPALLTGAMLHVDHTVFMNRIGDQMRFRALPGDGSKTMIYTLDIDTLASRAARFDHAMMVRLVSLFNTALDGKARWRVTCPAGTDVSGDMPPPTPAANADKGGFAVKLFPMSVHKPIAAGSMEGRIVLDRWVTGTNTHAYSPEVHYLAAPITVHVEKGHAVGFDGDEADVAAFRAHGRMVAETFGLDESLIHSWHAGMNPGTGYFARAKDDPVRWNGMIFGSPRHLHFHTCGDYPPGEINWHVIDPTVKFDGEVFIEGGAVRFFETDAVREVLAEYGLTPEDMATHQDIGL